MNAVETAFKACKQGKECRKCNDGSGNNKKTQNRRKEDGQDNGHEQK